jgi:hypothetical protein
MESYIHKRKIAKNEYNRDIAYLCQKFSQDCAPPQHPQETAAKSTQRTCRKKVSINHCQA